MYKKRKEYFILKRRYNLCTYLKQHFPKGSEISEFLELAVEFFFYDDCDRPISSCSYVFHYRTQKEDGTWHFKNHKKIK